MFRPKCIIDQHSGPVYSCSFDNRKWLYSSAGDKFVTRWDIETGGQDKFAVKLDSAAYTVLAHKEKLYIGTMNGELSVVDTASKSLDWMKNIYGNAIFSMAVSEQFHLFFAGDETGQLIVFDPAGRHLVTFPLNCGKIRSIRIFGEKMIIAAQDGTIRFFSLPELNEEVTLKIHENGANAFFLDGSLLFSGGKDGKLAVTDWQTGKILKSLPAHYQTIYGLTGLGNDRLVTASADKSIKIWDKEQLTVLQRIEAKDGGHRHSVNGVACLSDHSFATWSDDKRIIAWAEE